MKGYLSSYKMGVLAVKFKSLVGLLNLMTAKAK